MKSYVLDFLEVIPPPLITKNFELKKYEICPYRREFFTEIYCTMQFVLCKYEIPSFNSRTF